MWGEPNVDAVIRQATAGSRGTGKRALAERSNYITRDGFDALQSELEWLWSEERPKVTEAVSVAAALGDRSENAELHLRQEAPARDRSAHPLPDEANR